MSPDLLALPLQIQISIAAGFAAYAASYAGLRHNHRAQDAIIITGIFSGISLMFFELAGGWGLAVQFGAAVMVPLVLGVGWRSVYRGWWYGAMKALGVHKEDGQASAWDTLCAAMDDHEATEVRVYLKDGRELHLDPDLAPEISKPSMSKLSLGPSGDVLMAVTDEVSPTGKELVRTDIFSAEYGLLVTYISKEEIKRIEVRVDPNLPSAFWVSGKWSDLSARLAKAVGRR